MISPNLSAMGPVTLFRDKGAKGLITITARINTGQFFDYDFWGCDHDWTWEPNSSARDSCTCNGVSIYVHQPDQGGAQSFYIFPTSEIRELFLKWISIDKIGPKTVMKILEKTPASRVLELIALGDRTQFAKLRGVGPKGAEKAIPILFAEAPKPNAAPAVNPAEEDAIAALIALQYKATEAKAAIQKVSAPGLDTPTLVRLGLSVLLKR